MKRIYVLGMAVISFMAFSGCATTGPSKVASPELKSEFANAPKWVLNPDMEGGLSAMGSAKIGRAGMSFARTEALANARDELARQMSLKVKNMVKQFTQVTGIGDDQAVDKVTSQVSKQVANQTLNGSKQKDSWISPSNELYVLVVIDPNIVKKAVKNAATSSYKNDQALWQQFQAKKGHEELDKEIDKEFGDFKKE